MHTDKALVKKAQPVEHTQVVAGNTGQTRQLPYLSSAANNLSPAEAPLACLMIGTSTGVLLSGKLSCVPGLGLSDDS